MGEHFFNTVSAVVSMVTTNQGNREPGTYSHKVPHSLTKEFINQVIFDLHERQWSLAMIKMPRAAVSYVTELQVCLVRDSNEPRFSC